jgi:hypothetical protein
MGKWRLGPNGKAVTEYKTPDDIEKVKENGR